MKIGICAPIECKAFEEYLYEEDRIKSKGLGLGGSQVNQILNELLKREYEVSIFTLDKSVQIGHEIILRGENLTVYIGAFRRGKIITLDFQRYEKKYLEQAIRQDNPDIVHAHWTYEFALGVINSKVPHLISVRDWAPTILRLMPKPYRFMRFLMNFYVFYKGENFVANSLYIDKKIEKFVKNKYDFIPNGLRDDFFYTQEKKLNKNELKIVSIANGFGKLKNISTLIKAFEKVKKKFKNIRLILIGSDFEKEGIAHQWTKENSDDKNIEFLGKLQHNKMLKVLEQCDLLVHPALEESFGNTLIEAMAKKLPVIGGKNSGAVPWVLDYGRAGIITDITDENKLAKEIINILTDENKWKYYSENGYNRVWKEFRMSKIVDRYLKIYMKILEKK